MSYLYFLNLIFYKFVYKCKFINSENYCLKKICLWIVKKVSVIIYIYYKFCYN